MKTSCKATHTRLDLPGKVNPAMALACDHDHFQVPTIPYPPFTSQALVMVSVYFFTESQDLEYIFRFLASKM